MSDIPLLSRIVRQQTSDIAFRRFLVRYPLLHFFYAVFFAACTQASAPGAEEEETNSESPIPAGDDTHMSPVSTGEVVLEGVGTTEGTDPKKDPGNGAGEQEKEDEEEEAPPCPLPRINPCLTVRGNTLYVYGGLLEVKSGVLVHCFRSMIHLCFAIT